MADTKAQELQNWLKDNDLVEPEVLELLVQHKILLSTLMEADVTDIRELCKELHFSAPIRLKLLAAKALENKKLREATEEEEEEEEEQNEETEEQVQSPKEEEEEEEEDTHDEEEKQHIEKDTEKGDDDRGEENNEPVVAEKEEAVTAEERQEEKKDETNEFTETAKRFEEDADYAFNLQLKELENDMHTNQSNLTDNANPRYYPSDEEFARILAQEDQQPPLQSQPQSSSQPQRQPSDPIHHEEPYIDIDSDTDVNNVLVPPIADMGRCI
ncbi:hypothetical protein RFI_13854, partial [Reticulomyxa filosa]